MPRTNHRDFNVQMQIYDGKSLPQILFGASQDKDQRSISLQPGYEYVIELYPYGQFSTDDFKDMGMDKRGCRLIHEFLEEATHPIYTKDNCLYDCHVHQAYKKCQCVPWDFVKKIRNFKECDVFGRTCFHNMMENVTHSRDDNCPHCIDECDYIKYRRKVISSEPIKLMPKESHASWAGGTFCNRYICIKSTHRYRKEAKLSMSIYDLVLLDVCHFHHHHHPHHHQSFPQI